MDYFNADDVRKLCHAVAYFQGKADWRFAGRCVITWEFADRRRFHHAKMTLLRALHDDLSMHPDLASERLNRDNQAEIDCYGVTFRLLYKEV